MQTACGWCWIIAKGRALASSPQPLWLWRRFPVGRRPVSTVILHVLSMPLFMWTLDIPNIQASSSTNVRPPTGLKPRAVKSDDAPPSHSSIKLRIFSGFTEPTLCRARETWHRSSMCKFLILGHACFNAIPIVIESASNTIGLRVCAGGGAQL